MHRITPFVKRMRTNGGTIYTFSSAVEDIGLNINERNNVVKISHFALLDIPPIQQLTSSPSNLEVNRFNVTNLTGAFEYEQGNPSIKDGRVLIAESFQNYALNLESNLLNSEDYNPTLVRTVSERVFWKWLKETGAIRWSPDASVSGKQYWSEEIDADGSLGYNSVVKYVGQVSAGNIRTDSFGTYNETYILVPTSHGQMDAYFEIVEDDNYYHGMEISPANPNENILGRGNYTLPHPDGLSYSAYYDFVDSSTQVIAPDGTWTMTYDDSTGIPSAGWWYTAQGIDPVSLENSYLTDSSSYINTGIYNTILKYEKSGSSVEYKRSKLDSLSIVFNLDELKGVYADPELTYDKMAIQYSINDNFNFNAVLIYYTVYNSTMDEILGRNLLGVLFIDAPSGNSSNIPNDGIIIPSLEKIQSGPTGFGTSYSLRLNIKTDNMIDDTGATIVDMATSDQLYAEDWTEAFANLNTAVNLLTQNTSVIQHITEQYIEVQTTQTQILNDLQILQYQVNDIGKDITGTANTLALFADGDDPLVDSSVYMKFGNVGIKNNLPQYPLHVSGTTKLDEVIIQNAVKDTSGNILLGYGSPLQLGASTNYREVDIYTGNLISAIHIDISNNLILRDDVSILGQLSVDGSTKLSYLSVDSIVSSSFDFDKSYIGDTSVGTQFQWINGYLEIIASSDVSAAGNTGNLQFNSGGTMEADPSFNWKIADKRLGIRTADPSAVLHVAGDAIIDSSLTSKGNITADGYLSAGGNLTVGSNINGSNISWNATSRILEIAPGNGLSDGEIGSARLGMANKVPAGLLETDYLYTGFIVLGGGSSFAQYGTGFSAKSYRQSDGYYTYSHAMISQSSGLYTKYNENSNDAFAAGGGTWRLHPYITGNTDDRVLTATGANDINGEANLTFNGSTLKIIGDIAVGKNTASYTVDVSGTLNVDGSIYVDGNPFYGGAVSAITNNTDNYLLSATGGSTINGESGLSYSGTQLSVSGNIQLSDSSERVISLADSGASGGTLVIRGSGGGSGNGGDLVLETKGGSLAGGDIILRPGSGGSGRGSLYLNGDNSTYFGNAIYFYAGSATVEKLSLSTTVLQSAVPIMFSASDGYILQLGDADSGFYWDNTERDLYLSYDGNDRFRFSIDNGQFDAEGDIVGYSTAVSDIRLKENINELETPLQKILQVRGISYDRKKTGERHIGVIAQEIEKIIPEVVTETTLPLETGDDQTLYKTVRYTEIIPYLIESIKEQQKMIDELRAEINELKK
jgi:hypothetical protein